MSVSSTDAQQHRLPQPILPGFNPDPSIVEANGVYYLVTSTFEYLPGIPVYRSTDLSNWEQVGNVITREAQANLSRTPTPGGVWAPTIRHRNGVFYVIVSIMFSGHGCVLYTATDPAGPWSDGVRIPSVDGLDPDLVWSEDGTALVTFASWGKGILQVAVDLQDGSALEEPRQLWSGTGLLTPEGPHIYQRGDWWYLLIAEGGTERGHGVSIARGRSARGPFEGHPENPVLTKRSTDYPIQNVGHADMVDLPDGSSFWVLLGVRPVGFTRAFSPLGRETFTAQVHWENGWPQARLLPPNQAEGPAAFTIDFAQSTELDHGWISDRRLPATVGRHDPDQGAFVLSGEHNDVSLAGAPMLGRRITHHKGRVSLGVNVSRGCGGLLVRCSEVHWIALEATETAGKINVTARASLAGIQSTWSAELQGENLELHVNFTPAPARGANAAPIVGGDRITLLASTDTEHALLTELDGRYWSFETTESFTGRVIGAYARTGEVGLLHYTVSPDLADFDSKES